MYNLVIADDEQLVFQYIKAVIEKITCRYMFVAPQVMGKRLYG